MSQRPRVASDPALSRPIRWDVVPKPGAGARRLVVLSRVDALAFARSVAGVSPSILGALGSESHANRVVAWDPARGPILEPWRRARRRWQRDLRRLGNDARYAAVTDVRACYASISPRVMSDRLLALGATEAGAHQIGSWLHVFDDLGVDGLPVGPAASALLADAVLSAGDDAIRATGAAHVRWVDDVAIFAHDARTRATALEALRRTWAALGLELHDGKTALIDEPAGEARLGAASKSLAASSTLR
jgi:Reverse transcriptase (RNA-dependent DNA polymerase)